MVTKKARGLAALSIALASGISFSAPAFASGIALAGHRAVYDVELVEASERSGIDGMRGRIVYEFRGSACDGYTTNFRFVTQIAAGGTNRVTDQQTSTYEAGDGNAFRFITKTFVDEKLDKEVAGSAERNDSEIVVAMDKPEEGEFDLGMALFPTAHVLDMLDRAQKGETFYEARIFDGSDDADRLMTTTVIMGKPKSGDDGDEEAVLGPLAGEPYRNVSVAYFDESTGGEGVPEYRIAFRMHDNGVTRALEMDYGDFSLKGTLTEYEPFEQEPCD